MAREHTWAHDRHEHMSKRQNMAEMGALQGWAHGMHGHMACMGAWAHELQLQRNICPASKLLTVAHTETYLTSACTCTAHCYACIAMRHSKVSPELMGATYVYKTNCHSVKSQLLQG